MKLVASSGAASHAWPRSFFLHVMAWQRLKPQPTVYTCLICNFYAGHISLWFDFFAKNNKKMGAFLQKKHPKKFQHFNCSVWMNLAVICISQLKIINFSVKKLKKIKKSLRKLKKKSINLINFIFFLLNFLQTNNVFVDHHIVTLYVGNMHVSTHKNPSILAHS